MAADGAPGSEETLRDGRVVMVRSLRADDAAGVEALWRRLDAPARRRFTDLAHLPPDRAGDVALPRPGHAAGIIATTANGSAAQVAGVARYERTGEDTALSNTDVDEMLRSLRSYRLLTGYRQSPPLDVAAFAELLHRVSAMAEDIPEIAELDLNPVFVRRHGAVVVDTRIRFSG